MSIASGDAPAAGERMLQVEVALEPVDVGLLGRHLVARSGVDEHRSRTAHQQTAHRHADAIALVGRRFLLPERFRNHAEHRPAIEVEEPVGDGHDLDVAEPDRLRPLGLAADAPAGCFSSTSTPWALDGWMNATLRALCAGSGLVVDEPDVPLAAAAASAARMSSTRSVM